MLTLVLFFVCFYTGSCAFCIVNNQRAFILSLFASSLKLSTVPASNQERHLTWTPEGQRVF